MNSYTNQKSENILFEIESLNEQGYILSYCYTTNTDESENRKLAEQFRKETAGSYYKIIRIK